MNEETYKIDYEKWGQLITKSQVIIASVVCVVEIIDNALLYITRSQGYGPDTIVEKLIRYLLMTSLINFGLVVISAIVEKRVRNQGTKKYLLMLFTILICADVAYSHYQFSITFAIFAIPIMICLLYEDKKLSVFTLIASVICELAGIIARALDDGYNKDIGPESAIAISLTISIYVFAKIIENTLEKRGNAVREAIVNTEKVKASAEKMSFSMKMLETLAGTIDAKDKYTNGHSLRVSIYSTKIAERMGWSKEKISLLKYEALLHDIGKIGVPDAILNKPSKLSNMEFALIKSHSVVGADILKNMVAVPKASEVARYHHERFDGRGYPDRISGENIPLDARIVCIADSYDAMNSDRIYRKALSKDIIREELIKGRGTQFDPDILDVFLQLLDEGELENINQMSINDIDEIQQIAMDDIKSILLRYNEATVQRESIDDFDKIYEYMKNIGTRYHRSVEVIELKLVKKEDNELYIDKNEADEILQLAIRKNIRSVDVYQKVHADIHMVILMDAGLDNIDIVTNRIRFEYESSVVSNAYEINIRLSDYIEKK